MSYHPISDPFPRKNLPVKPGEFYDRPSVIAQINTSLTNGQSVSIVGERRAGKSSLWIYLEENLDNQQFIPIKIDAQLIIPKSDHVFLKFLIISTAEKVRRVLSLPDSLPLSIKAADATTSYEAFLNDLEIIEERLKQAANYSQHRIIWLIDEIEVLRAYKDTNLFTFLRPLALDNDRFRMVVFGCDVLYELVSASEWPAFFSAFKLVSLNGLQSHIAKQMVVDAMATFGGALDDDKYKFILNWTGCKPYFIKHFCSILVDALNLRATDYQIDSTVLSDTINVFLNAKDINDHFNYIWKKHATVNQQIILSVLAQDPKIKTSQNLFESMQDHKLIQGDNLALQHIKDDLTRLEQQGFLFQRNGEITFSSGCLPEWIKIHKPI